MITISNGATVGSDLDLTSLTSDVAEVMAEVEEVETHLHSAGRWFGCEAGETVVAAGHPASIGTLIPHSVVISDTTQTFGDATMIFLGTEANDIPGTETYLDPHEILIMEVGLKSTWKLRFANSGWTGSADTYADFDAAVAAGKYTDVVLKIDSTTTDGMPVSMQTGRMRVGSKLWCKGMNNSTSSDNAAARTITFLIGCHFYLA